MVGRSKFKEFIYHLLVSCGMLIMIYPLLWMLFSSFKPTDMVLPTAAKLFPDVWTLDNYVRGWKEEFVYTIEAIHGTKGAAFTMACIGEAQKSTIDMLMYYDTRPSAFCGAFDFYTYRPLKGYYPLYWYGKFYDMDHEVRCENQPENIYTLAGVDKNGKALATVTYYTEEDDTAKDKEVAVDFGKEGEYEIYLLDADHDGELISTTKDLTFTLKPCSFILIKEI